MRSMESEMMIDLAGGRRITFDCGLAGAGIIVTSAITLAAPPVGIGMALLGIAGFSLGIASVARACG